MMKEITEKCWKKKQNKMGEIDGCMRTLSENIKALNITANAKLLKANGVKLKEQCFFFLFFSFMRLLAISERWPMAKSI